MERFEERRLVEERREGFVVGWALRGAGLASYDTPML